jgi:outer membrane protein insertion porin family
MKKIFTPLNISLLSAALLVGSVAPRIVFAQSAPSETVAVKTVKAIDVEGNKTISMATILSKIKTRVGQDYIEAVVSDDIKRLYNTGYFADVRVDKEDQDGGVKVIINLEEKSIVEEITFSKTRYIKAPTIKRKIKTQVGKFLDNKLLQDDINTIKDLYAQKGLTKVEVDLEKFVDEVTNKASLHFVIREGQKIRIKKINVFGNNTFSNAKILKIIKSRKKWAFNSGYMKEDTIEEDMGRISSFYEQNGFIDAKVKYDVDQLYSGLVEVNIQIEEGKRYYVGSLEIAGNKIITTPEIAKAMTGVQEKGVFSREKLTGDLADIRSLYFDKGYIFANVDEATSLDPDTGKVDVHINIEEGQVAYIEKVKIQGNTRTRDIVIRRELKTYPGDKFDGAKLKRSKERLSNLGYFEDVSFDIEDTDTYDRKDLLVQVKEAKTGTFSFGGGFSTVDKIVGFVEIEQRNFDFTNWPTFTGGGQQLELRAETGSSRNNVRLSFTEPWLFDHPISGGFDAYRSSRNREESTGYAYDEDRLGGDIRFGKEFSEYVSGNVMYKLENVEIADIEAGSSADLLAEEGSRRK